ncbi:unnamed protein product (macronuclear) [Paramecium tetraurelia]|uniref:non-specific serine/threonine protein kinase n=1 Tax=Paramecium tetraurelia TaxID=5888 RepID=A0E3X8_PARTE|nr:uncharacterized protein GSPATT00023168001 [Paramecium tetraurelia]CAK89995.1 unnamed protein product [Paramecium tetraurelia]|eukprot:XP_001457392.1 hypothetical protein (macronuclear) [Paramecium tetraurelia strain d4-2]
MGANSSKQNFELLNEYNFLNIAQDDGYGEIQLFSNKTKRTDQMALIKFYDQSDMEKRANIIQLRYIMMLCRKQQNNQYFTKILDYQVQTTEDLCSNINLLHVGLEYLEKSLQDDILNRRANDRTYNEGELWYLAQTILSGLKDLQINNLQYHDLHPNNIRIKLNGEVKLLELCCLANQQSAYQKVFTQLREVEYLTPEQLYVLENERQNDKQEYSIEKQNVFILGVIFLVCITNMDVKKFYNNFTFNSELANQKLNSTFEKYNYSDPMKHLLKDLLQLNTYHRPSYLEILDKISHVDSNRISPNLYALNMQDQAIKSTLRIKSQNNFSQEQIIESQPQSLYEQHNLINDSFNRQVTSNFQANLESAPVAEVNKQNNYDFEITTQSKYESNYQQTHITSQGGLDKIRQLKERFQVLKGEAVQQQQAATVPTTFTHQDDTETYRISNQNIQNPYQPNFLDMDPVIQRALQKSREVMSKCNPYQTTDPYVPILPQTNNSFLPQPGMPSNIQPIQTIPLGNSQLNQYFQTSQLNPQFQSQFNQYNQINQAQPPPQLLQQSQFQKQPSFSQSFSPYIQQNEQISPLKQPAISQYIQQQTIPPPSFNQQQSMYQPYVRNDRFS